MDNICLDIFFSRQTHNKVFFYVSSNSTIYSMAKTDTFYTLSNAWHDENF